MYLAIITLPLLGSIASGFFGRKVGVSGAQLIACTSVIITTLLAIVAFFEVGLNNVPTSINIFRWIDSESLNVLWGFHFDSLTVSMLIPVLIVSSLVHVYSIGYMSHDPHNQRFFSYLSLFTFMMIILVTSNNFLLMFVGWEGVGICSYLLVSFWFTRIAANQSSMSAFLTNRVGDCFLTIGMFAILWSFGNIDYATVFSLAPFVNENIVTIIGICLLIGAMAKSSQIGLHVWLPMAMEGPTPVSALIHAATMVTAGVYLLMRTSPLIEYSSTVLVLCLWLGAITTVFSSLIGLFQQDIKKVIAYSTMSQLGMMVIAVGLSSYNVALFHLINHAFYKGLLFLGAGAVIHAVADNQDFRKYGGLRPFLPLTYSVMLIASLSLVAFPFMTGFYSKDFILESAYGEFYYSSTVVYFIATIGAMFTTLYSVKVLFLTFLTNPNGPVVSYKHAHEGDIYMSLPLMILAVFSIFFGFITKDIYIGLGSDFFTDNSIFIHPIHEIMLDTEFAVPTLFKLLPLIFTVSLSALAIILSEFLPRSLMNFKFSRIGYNIFGFFNQRFYIELFYNKYVTGLVFTLGGLTTKIVDKGSVELIGPYGLEIVLIRLSNKITSLSTGAVTSYALYISIGLIIFSILVPLDDYAGLLLSGIGLLGVNLKNYLSLDKNINKVNSPNISAIKSSINPFKLDTLVHALRKLSKTFSRKNLKVLSLTILVSTMVSFTIRALIVKYWSIDVFKDLLDYPGTSFAVIGLFTALRAVLGITLPTLLDDKPSNNPEFFFGNKLTIGGNVDNMNIKGKEASKDVKGMANFMNSTQGSNNSGPNNKAWDSDSDVDRNEIVRGGRIRTNHKEPDFTKREPSPIPKGTPIIRVEDTLHSNDHLCVDVTRSPDDKSKPSRVVNPTIGEFNMNKGEFNKIVGVRYTKISHTNVDRPEKGSLATSNLTRTYLESKVTAWEDRLESPHQHPLEGRKEDAWGYEGPNSEIQPYGENVANVLHAEYYREVKRVLGSDIEVTRNTRISVKINFDKYQSEDASFLRRFIDYHRQRVNGEFVNTEELREKLRNHR